MILFPTVELNEPILAEFRVVLDEADALCDWFNQREMPHDLDVRTTLTAMVMVTGNTVAHWLALAVEAGKENETEKQERIEMLEELFRRAVAGEFLSYLPPK